MKQNTEPGLPINSNQDPPNTLVTLGQDPSGQSQSLRKSQPHIASESQRKKALLEMYQIDKQERLPNVPKINNYNYQTLLVHNPDYSAQ